MSEITREDVETKLATADNVRVAVFDVDLLRYVLPEWDALPYAAKRAHLLDPPVPPTHESTSSNVTCVGLHEHVAELLTFDTRFTDEIDRLSTLAIGDDWGGGTSPDSTLFTTSDTSLNNRIGEITITDPRADGATFEINEFLSSNELNGETIREVGIEKEDGTLCNHAPTSQEYAKDQTMSILFSVSIPTGDAG